MVNLRLAFAALAVFGWICTALEFMVAPGGSSNLSSAITNAGAQQQVPCSSPNAIFGQCPFLETFATWDKNKWGYFEGNENNYSSYFFDNISVRNGRLCLKVSIAPRVATGRGLIIPFATGAVGTNHVFGYGCFESLLEPPGREGLINVWELIGNGNRISMRTALYGSSLALYTTAYDEDRREQTEYSRFILPGGKAGFRRFAFKWTASRVEFFLSTTDGYERVSFTETASMPDLKAPLAMWYYSYIGLADDAAPDTLKWADNCTRVRYIVDAVRHTPGVPCEFENVWE